MKPDLHEDRIARLLTGYVQGKLTEEEKTELKKWIEASEDNCLMFEKVSTPERLFKFIKEEYIKRKMILEEIKRTIKKEKSDF